MRQSIFVGKAALAIALVLAFAQVSPVAAEPKAAELQAQINALQKQVNTLKAKEAQTQEIQEQVDALKVNDEKREKLADKFKFSGDYQFRYDFIQAKFDDQVSLFALQGNAEQALADMQDQFFNAAVESLQAEGADTNIVNIQNRVQQIMAAVPPEQVGAMLAQYGAIKGHTARNDSVFTNRLRLNMKAKVAENVDFKGRLAMYKIWGMQSADSLSGNGMLFPMKQDAFLFDAGPGHVPSDNALRVDRAYVNWNKMFGAPLWLSVGRRPTTGGPPSQLRQGLDFHDRQATPASLGIDYAFDGVTLGLFMKRDWYPLRGGKFRFCYGKGFESGFDNIPGQNSLDDALFYGISYDIVNDKENDVFANLQSFRADELPDAMDSSATANLGDIWQSTFVFMNKLKGVEWFLSGSWSHAMPSGYTDAASRTFDADTLAFLDSKGVNMEVGMLTNPGEETKDRDGFAVYTGFRVPVVDWFKLGAEYNYGSKYWVSFAPSVDDDLWNPKTATRGHVAEAYGIFNVPLELWDDNSKMFFKLGYQYYRFEYTGSGSYMGAPIDIDNLSNPGVMTVMASPKYMHQMYLTLNVYF